MSATSRHSAKPPIFRITGGWGSVSPSQVSAPKDMVSLGATEEFMWLAFLGNRIHLE